MKRFSTMKQCCKIAKPGYDVFINHCSIDSKRSIAPLLYDHLRSLGIRSFLDTRHMKPGHKLFHHIDNAIQGCKVGVAVLSPNYCNSYFCLHELALLSEYKKRVVPIFYDIKPSQLRVMDDASSSCYSPQMLQKFCYALEETKCTVGVAFDSSKGDWSELLRKTSEAVIMELLEVEDEENH